MTQFFSSALEACMAAIILIPGVLMLNKFRVHSSKTTFLYILFCIYLSGVYAVVGPPNVAYIRFDLNLNLIPFSGMLSDPTAAILNMLLFFPLGLFLPILWPRYRGAGRTLFIGFSLSLAVELLQIFTFRATDVNDLITNTLGTLIGWAAGRLLILLIPSLVCNRPSRELPLLLGITCSVMFCFQPLIWMLISWLNL